MDTVTVIDSAKRLGLVLAVSNGRLRVTGSQTAEAVALVRSLAAMKAAIIAHLDAQQLQPGSAPEPEPEPEPELEPALALVLTSEPEPAPAPALVLTKEPEPETEQSPEPETAPAPEPRRSAGKPAQLMCTSVDVLYHPLYDQRPNEMPAALTGIDNAAILLAAQYRCQRCAWSQWSKPVEIIPVAGGHHVLCAQCKAKLGAREDSYGNHAKTNLQKLPSRRSGKTGKTPVECTEADLLAV